MSTRTLLLTGPADGADRYADAARGAGWEALVHPLLEIRPIAVDLTALEATPDWICVTSRNALFPLEQAARKLRGVPCATVGNASAQRLRNAGFLVSIAGAASASDLASRLAPQLSGASVVLWPRGSLSDDLADSLSRTGARMLAPVVYETVDSPDIDELPAASAIFFASPSAVDAWARRTLARCPKWALAIGPATADAIARLTPKLPDPLVLTEPSPMALANRLNVLGTSE